MEVERDEAIAMVNVRLMPDGRLVRERDGVVETLTPRVDRARLAATTEAEIAAQEAEDEAEARNAANCAMYIQKG